MRTGAVLLIRVAVCIPIGRKIVVTQLLFLENTKLLVAVTL